VLLILNNNLPVCGVVCHPCLPTPSRLTLVSFFKSTRFIIELSINAEGALSKALRQQCRPELVRARVIRWCAPGARHVLCLCVCGVVWRAL